MAELTVFAVECDEWTTMKVKNNKLKIIKPNSSVSIALVNVRFLVRSSGTLRIDNEVTFAPADTTSTQVSQYSH